MDYIFGTIRTNGTVRGSLYHCFPCDLSFCAVSDEILADCPRCGGLAVYFRTLRVKDDTWRTLPDAQAHTDTD